MDNTYNDEDRKYNKEAQELYINCLLTDAELFVLCQGILNPSYFDISLRKAVKFLIDYSTDFNKLPTADIIKAKTGISLIKLVEYDEDDRAFLIEEIEAFCRHQAVVKAIIECTTLLEKNETDAIEGKIKDALLVSIQREIGTNYFEDPKGRLLKLKSQNGNMSTGWSSVDRKLYNVSRGELMVFAANSGGGKSLVLQNLAVNFSLQNLNVVYITLELSEELCSKRMDAMFTGVACSDIYKEIDTVDKSIKKHGTVCGNITIKRFPANTTNAIALRSYLKEYQIQKGFKPDILLIDYLDLMTPNNGKIDSANLFIKDKFISEELRNLSIELDFLVCTASQLNRSAIDSMDYDHSHIAGGKSKVDTADNFIGIRNDNNLKERGVIAFNYLKTRNSGGVGSTTELDFDINTLRISEPQDDPSKRSNAHNNSSIINNIAKRSNTGVKKETSTVTETVDNNRQRIQNLLKKK